MDSKKRMTGETINKNWKPKQDWKYKRAYEVLADFIFECDKINSDDKAYLSERLDEIFGRFRRC